MTQLADIGERPIEPIAPEKHDGATTAKVPDTLWVMDLNKPEKGPRTHEMPVAEYDGRLLIKKFTFEPSKPVSLPFAIAIKFLKIPGFVRTNEAGDIQPYHRQPKQPYELGAGEKFELKDSQTVAEYGELSNMALLQRTLELPGGELIDKNKRQDMIDFIVKTTLVRRKLNADKAGVKAAADVELGEIPPVDEE